MTIDKELAFTVWEAAVDRLVAATAKVTEAVEASNEAYAAVSNARKALDKVIAAEEAAVPGLNATVLA